MRFFFILFILCVFSCKVIMVVIKSNSYLITVTVAHKAVLINKTDGQFKIIECDQKMASTTIGNDTNNQNEMYASPSSDISNCGTWFVFTYGKCLSLWNLNDLSLVSNRELQKRSSKVRFSPEGRSILVADKTGDVYHFSTDNPLQPGILLLGHLSMLLDVIITPDERFIITCDRDEKIRVSSYPNAYNIHSYCLGHEEFVTSLNLLPHCKDILVSTSGDGTVRLWDFKTGREIYTLNCKTIIKLDDASECCAVSSTAVQIGPNESLVGVILDDFEGCLVYNVKGTSTDLICKHVEIKFSSEPLDIFIDGKKVLWILLHEGIVKINALKWDGSTFAELPDDDIAAKPIKNLNQVLSNFGEFKQKDFIPLLYKKSFNNVEEYLKRKNERLSGQKNKKLKNFDKK